MKRNGVCHSGRRHIPGWTLPTREVLQNVTARVALAFKALFRRVKAGDEPGYPRFRGRDRYDSLTYPQYGNGCQMADDTLKLSKVGAVRIKAHRPLEGTPKTCTIRRTSTGKWYATIACEVEPQPLPESPQETGLDVGLSHFYTLSDGTPTPCPRFLRRDEKDLPAAYPAQVVGCAPGHRRTSQTPQNRGAGA